MGDSSRPSYSAPTVGLCADGLSSRDILKGDSRDEVLRIIRDYVVELSCRGSKGQGELIVESVVDKSFWILHFETVLSQLYFLLGLKYFPPKRSRKKVRGECRR